ncbi:MAG: NnrS family protein [Pseudomonadota bacterium]
MKRTAETQRSWSGPAILGGGFRPFFLGAALWAAAAVAVWLPFLSGTVAIPTAFSPVDWHVHEMIYGYGAAVVAGFLLTAVPNWTGRLPIAGWPLGWLFALWAAGRIAVFASAAIGAMPAALIDSAFLVVFACMVGREIAVGRNQRNLKVVVLVLLLAIANAAFHAEAAVKGAATLSTRAGLAVIVFLILLIGGRVVPSFTHNWLARQGEATRPVPFGRPDGVVMVLSAIALVMWIVVPDWHGAGAILLAAGAANLWRLSRWLGWRTRSDVLVLVLHLGFLLTTLGFVSAGISAFRPDLAPPVLGIHIWAIGGIGTMTLAMMTRATLGHTGRSLSASKPTQLIYLAVLIALVARGAAVLLPGILFPLLYVAVAAWCVAFAGFSFVYGAMLVRPRRPAESGGVRS